MRTRMERVKALMETMSVRRLMACRISGLMQQRYPANVSDPKRRRYN